MSRIVPTILVVEDDDAFRRILVKAFQERGYEAEGVADGASAIAAAQHESPEMAVVDLRLPDQSGLDVVRQLKAIEDQARARADRAKREFDAKVTAMRERMKQANDREKAKIEKRMAEAKADYAVRTTKLEQAGKLVREAMAVR